MKVIPILSLVMLFLFCKEKQKITAITKSTTLENEIVVSEFQSILDSAKVTGAILLYNLQKDTYFSNDFIWAQEGQLPASTFKIPNSIIALEAGVVENDSTLFEWDGKPRAIENWEQDLILKDAFHFSCVPCYQEVAGKIGSKRMNDYVKKLNYGQIKVDSLTLENFWLQGDSRISPFQQIDFLKRLYQSELPITKRTEKIVKRMMVTQENKQYTISGKTGWSISNGENNGWFIGYIQTKNNIHFFATNVEPLAEFNMAMFPMIRKEVTFKALKHMELID